MLDLQPPTMTVPGQGVQFNAPPAKLIPDLRASMERAVAQIPQGKKVAFVAVGTRDGEGKVAYNVGVVAKISDDWKFQTWIGKKWGEEVSGGVAVIGAW